MTFVLEPRGYLDPDVLRLVEEVQQEYVVRYGGPDRSAIDPAEFEPPAGLLLVGLLDGVAVATGAWRRSAGASTADTTVTAVTAVTAEVKRMFVSPAYRRRGLSRLVLAGLERSAAAAGVTRLILNTGGRQPEAIALYETSGYSPGTPFGHYQYVPGALFYEKTIEPAP